MDDNLTVEELREFARAVEFFIHTEAVQSEQEFRMKTLLANIEEKRNLIRIANQPPYAAFFNRFKSIT